MVDQQAQEIIQALSEPFPDDQVFHRVDERTGKELSYISAANVYRRLNKVVPGWKFSITNTSMQKIETKRGPLTVAVVTAAMEIPGVGTRMGMGSAPIYAPDDFKAATTDSLKRCASLFGVALYLYGGDDQAPQQQQPQQGYQQAPQQPSYQNQGGGYQQQAPQPQQQRQQYPQGGGNYDNSQPVQYNAAHDSGEMRTDPQSRKLGFELGDKGMGITQASQQSGIPVAGDSIDTITKKQATALIDWLTRQTSGGGQQQAPQGDGGYGGGYQDNQDLNQVPF